MGGSAPKITVGTPKITIGTPKITLPKSTGDIKVSSSTKKKIPTKLVTPNIDVQPVIDQVTDIPKDVGKLAEGAVGDVGKLAEDVLKTTVTDPLLNITRESVAKTAGLFGYEREARDFFNATDPDKSDIIPKIISTEADLSGWKGPEAQEDAVETILDSTIVEGVKKADEAIEAIEGITTIETQPFPEYPEQQELPTNLLATFGGVGGSGGKTREEEEDAKKRRRAVTRARLGARRLQIPTVAKSATGMTSGGGAGIKV